VTPKATHLSRERVQLALQAVMPASPGSAVVLDSRLLPMLYCVMPGEGGGMVQGMGEGRQGRSL
jgi:hypothetical protein